MSVSTTIARKYFFSKKNKNVINIIGFIAMGGIGVGTFALIVVLSAFNGLENLVNDLYSDFDPDIKVTATHGKFFDENLIDDSIFDWEEIASVAIGLEDLVMIKHLENQTFAVLKGVSSNFIVNAKLPNHLYDGDLALWHNDIPYAIMGYGIAHQLEYFVGPLNPPLVLYVARNDIKTLQNPQNAFRTISINPSGIFAINPDYDFQYVLVPIEFAREAFDLPKALSSFEIILKQGVKPEAFRDKLQAFLGDDFTVKTKYQLNEIIYKTNQSEKWVTFFILSFILLIATFNLLGSISMLIIEKQKDIKVIKSFGGNLSLIRNIFFKQGMLIGLSGGAIGVALGVIVVLLQKHVGLLALQGAIVSHYPVDLHFSDILLVTIMLLMLTALGAIVPIWVLLHRYYKNA